MSADESMSEMLIKKYHEFVRAGLNKNKKAEAFEFPSVDGKSCLDIRHDVEVSFSHAHISERLGFLGDNFLPKHQIGDWTREGLVEFKETDLEKLGLALLPYVSFGVLNGGSATSYLDTKKNQQFAGEELFNLYEGLFQDMQESYMGYPKGATPAYMNNLDGMTQADDRQDGISYLELKLRHILLLQKKYKETFGRPCKIGFFQMTSPSTDKALEEAYARMESSPFLTEVEGAKELLDSRKTGIQNLVWAFESALDADPNRNFFEFQSEGETKRLGLPGGHGQNFYVLKPVYAELEKEGYRFAYLGNIDNLGFTINPKALALLALKGGSAGFEFSFKTALDKKGGVLVKEQGVYTCLDIGGGIDAEAVNQAESNGAPILFNCATGLFDLKYLNQNIDYIIENLPVRFTEQDKDVGRYAQAEQITWEVLSLLKNPLIFCVEKADRFLAAKFALEMFLTCGLYRDNANFPFDKQELASRLYKGFNRVMREVYGMELYKGKWDTKE